MPTSQPIGSCGKTTTPASAQCRDIRARCRDCRRRRCPTPRCARGPIPGYRRDMTTDSTGAPTTVTQESDRFSISVDGKQVGFTEYADRDGQRIFPHTEVLDEYGGRGLGTIVIAEALQATRDAGLRIVAV